ncbi:MAG: tetratricopeptide repeat protein [Gammaproteobacteria bacterium]|nr:tetratricopeptide repeat protein [Gammaproteobacteria bacterium]
MTGLITELRRRNVFRVAIAYLVFSWLLLQVTDILLPIFEAPLWVQRVLVLLLGLGFVAAIIFSWVYELTPEGLKRESEVDHQESITGDTAKKLDIIVIILIVIALPLSFVGRDALDVGNTPPDPASDKAGTSEVSIAVLPFLDLSADEDQGYFALGMSEELLNALANVPGLSVASRTSAFAFEGSDLGAGPIGEALGVNHVLEGSIRKAGDRLRITAQLIDVDSDRHLWSQTYDRRLEDVFAIQDEITTAIVEALREPLGITDVAAAVQLPAGTDNMNAYELFLEGREHFIQRDLTRSIALLERVVELDPGFARGWVLLSAAYALAPGWISEDRPWFELANATLDHAEELDPQSSMLHATRGLVLNTLTQSPETWPDARAHFERALELDPRNASAHLWYGIYWAQAGFFERAWKHFAACLDSDPSYFNCRRHHAVSLLAAGRRDEGLAIMETVMRENQFTPNAPFVATAYLEAGNEAMALYMINDLLGVMDIEAPGWIHLVKDPAADPLRRELLAKQLREKMEHASYGVTLPANQLLVTIHRPQDLQLGDLDFLWPMMHFKAYRDSGRFADDTRKTGIAYLWDEIGPPPFCERRGDSYHCEPPGTN